MGRIPPGCVGRALGSERQHLDHSLVHGGRATAVQPVGYDRSLGRDRGDRVGRVGVGRRRGSGRWGRVGARHGGRARAGRFRLPRGRAEHDHRADGADDHGHDDRDEQRGVHQGRRGQAADQRHRDHQHGPAELTWAGRPGSAAPVGAHCPTCGTWLPRRNVTSCGLVLRSAGEQIQPASTCVVRTLLPQPIGGWMHTWYCPAGTLEANSRAGLRVPVTTLVSVPVCSTFTWVPGSGRPSPSLITLTVSLSAAPWLEAELAVGGAVLVGAGVAPGPGAGVSAWPVNPPITSTATNAVACANNGTASFLRSRLTTGGIPPLPARAVLACHGPSALVPTTAERAACAAAR